VSFDAESARKDFPILHQMVHGKPLIFLDSAASAQKPQAVIDAVSRMYSHDYANVHRGVYELSVRATEAVEGARDKVAAFIGGDRRETIFVRNATEAINLVARSWGWENVNAGDEVLITHMEHHANIVPWQMLCEEVGATLKVAPIDDRGQIDLEAFRTMLSRRTKLVGIAHVSNALGTINPVAEITRMAHEFGAVVLVDGAQAVPHGRVDVRTLGCDFYAFSGHKLFGPSGVGVLWGRAELLEAMPPFLGGGEMILSVTFEKSTYKQIPYKFEAGTPDIAGIAGLGAAIDYLEALDLDAVAVHEHGLLEYATERLSEVPGLRIIGTAEQKAAVVSFVLDGIHPHDIGTILDQEGIAVRTGHHCAQPVMQRFGVPATARASMALYNVREDVDALIRGIAKVQEVFA
jgi:cysteine desulfurase/selenocysteine lyase